MRINKIQKALFLVVMVLMTACGVFAQSDIASPYSRFGLGTMTKNKVNTMLQGMGGVGNAIDGKYLLNTANPAAYAEMDSLTFLLDAGFYIGYATFRTDNASDKGSDASIDYFDIGFGITKWYKVGLGVTPMSNRDYSSTDEFVWAYDYPYNIDYAGGGGLNRIYWSNGFKVFKNLSLGFKFNYIYGNIIDVTTLYFPDYEYFHNEIRTISLEISDVTFDFGLIYKHNLKNDYRLTLGLTYSMPTNLTAHRTAFIRTMFNGYGDNATVTPVDTILYENNKRVDVKYPQSVGLGVSLQKGERWLLSMDFNWSNWEAYRIDGKSDSLQNFWNVAIGANYTPSHTTVSSYFRKMNYRAGLHFDQTFFNIYGKSINKYGITFGVGMPIQRAGATINFALEIGRMGTTKNNLVSQTYFNFSLGVSLHDRWFVKRRYK